MSKSRIVLAVMGIGLVLGIWAVTSFMKNITQTPETFIVGEQFIEHLAAAEYDAAIALAASEYQDAESRALLESLAQQNVAILNADTVVNLTGRGIDNDIRYAYGTVSANSAESPLYMEFVDENGDTRVSFFSFNADDMPNYSDSGETAE